MHYAAALFFLAVCGCSGEPAKTDNPQVAQRAQMAAYTMTDAVVVDCQMPGRLQQLGGGRSYLAPGALMRLTAIDCRIRGGEYTIGDLGSGTLSLKLWLPRAEAGDAESQYFVARIYFNGMGVPADYAAAAKWYERAADQHYAAALEELGYMYEQGIGVPKDPLRALNLQRQASGLGNDLDYAWKIGEAQQQAARQIAELTDRLDGVNAEVGELRARWSSAQDALAQSRARRAKDEDQLLNLRAQLELARRDAGDARVKELQSQLAEREAAFKQSQESVDSLTRQVSDQQVQLAASLQKYQAATLQLNAVLASDQDDNKNLRARLAESDQRLLRTQQELGELRASYRQEVEALTAQRSEYEQLKAQSSNSATALVSLKQRDADRAQLRVQALEAELAELHRTGSDQATATDAQKAHSAALQGELDQLQKRYAETQKSLQDLRAQMANQQSQSQSERDGLMQKMTAELASRSADLDGRQRSIAALQAEVTQLQAEAARYRSQHSDDLAKAASDNARSNEALRVAQQKISEQHDELDRLKTESATERLALIQDRDRLQQRMAESTNSQNVSQAENARLQVQIQELQADIKDREAKLASRQQYITTLEQKLRSAPPALAANGPSSGASNVTFRMPTGDAPTVAAANAAIGVSAGADDPSRRINLVRSLGTANYYALVIGNSKYVHMSPLATPGNDAQAVARLLGGRQYGYTVQLLLDATADKIMWALNEYTLKLTEADRLLVYYAGHGGTRDGPPDRGFWLGVDADPDLESGWLSAESIRGKIKQMKARHVLLVADSCFSGSIAHPDTTTVWRDVSDRVVQIEWGRRARMVLTSGQNTPVVDSMGDSKHSLCAKYFIKVLRENTTLMTGEQLSYELASRMQADARRLGVRQTPTYSTLSDANHDYGEFFFVPVAAPEMVASVN